MESNWACSAEPGEWHGRPTPAPLLACLPAPGHLHAPGHPACTRPCLPACLPTSPPANCPRDDQPLQAEKKAFAGKVGKHLLSLLAAKAKEITKAGSAQHGNAGLQFECACPKSAHAETCPAHYAHPSGTVQMPASEAGKGIAQLLQDVGWLCATKTTAVHYCACHLDDDTGGGAWLEVGGGRILTMA